ncbi:MAG: alpha-glucuronidase family glycosyl hydrolase [Planctomycetota bacterium]
MSDDRNICKKWSAIAFFFLVAVLLAQGCQAQSVSIVISGRASGPERIAGEELGQTLSKLYPNQRFKVTAEGSGASFSILVGTPRSLPQIRDYVLESELKGGESFVVKNTIKNGRRIGVIAGKTGRAVLYGVYQLLEKLGCGVDFILRPIRCRRLGTSFRSMAGICGTGLWLRTAWSLTGIIFFRAVQDGTKGIGFHG